MGFIGGIVRRLIKLILYLALVVAFIVLIPNLPPYTKFTRIELEPTQPRVGALAPNDALNNAQALYKDKLLGPETFQLWNGEIYTGLATGEIVKVSPGGHVTFVTKIGQPCSGIIQEHICGRPLGFVIDEKNKLMYVADAYHGIWKVDLVSDKKQLLVSPRVPIDGKLPKIFNSVALDKNGDLYWTASSTDFDLRDGVVAGLVDPSGRLFHYNSAKNISKVLLDDVWFANGVVISPDSQFVLLAESSRYRILKYYIDGPKRGTSEVFVAGLPGVPDVLRPLPDGSGLLATLYTVFDDEHPLLTKTMSSAPLARKFIARVLRLIEIPFEFLQSQFPNYIFENIVYQIGHFGSIANFMPGKTGIVQIDWHGNIVASYYNTDGSLLHISDVIVFNNKLYTGCPHLQNYIGAVPAPPQLIKAFTAKKVSAKEQPNVESKSPQLNKPKVEEKKEVPKTAKPATQTTPSTTTTTKPNEIPKEKVVRQNTAPKESEREREADIKVKEEKPKTTPKQGDEKPKIVPKDAEVKSKVTSKDTEAKLKVAQKEEDTKMKATPQNTAQAKPTNKNQEKPVKEAESKAKVAKTDSVKPEPSKEKRGADKPGVKGTVKAPEPKSEQQNTKTKPASDPKPKKTDAKESAKAKPEPKVIPVVENIPSDTAKPKKEKLKVIKKTGPEEIPNPIL